MDTKFWSDLWGFLNQNFVSSLFEAMIFGLIATYLFYKFSGASEKKSLTKQTRLILNESIDANKENVMILLAQLKKNDVTRVPDPLDVTLLKVLLQGKFTEVMEADLVKQVARIYRISELINKDYAALHETFNGIAVSIQGVEGIRNKIVAECTVRMETLQKEIDVLSEKLEKLK